MLTPRHIISPVLVLLLLSSGMPAFSPEDASRDRRVDLRDAILLVKDFATSAENPESFSESMGRVVSTLNVVVGFASSIQPSSERSSANAPLLVDLTYLVSSSNDLPIPNTYSMKYPRSATFKSVTIAPTLPPPRTASA